MILHIISRQFQNPKLHSLYPKLFSSSSISFSKLKEYDFSPPEHLSVKPNSTKPNVYENPKPKRQKPLYKPPSSLDTTDFKPLHSDLPFDFRFSYTESSPYVRPVGQREPKYSPFGPSRIDRVWTGVCAPVIDPIGKSVDDGNEGGVNLEEKRKKLRDDVLGKSLSDAERKILVDKCQRIRTKRQINLGRDGFTHNMLNGIHNNWKTLRGCKDEVFRCSHCRYEKRLQPTSGYRLSESEYWMFTSVNVQHRKMANTKNGQVCGREGSVDPPGHQTCTERRRWRPGCYYKSPGESRVCKVVTTTGWD
ncbi:hypothetical protein MKW92_020538 [Papaver armeniacum]|nr:hypothetical protein MKW92_020538 [Papaver armeniacum]